MSTSPHGPHRRFNRTVTPSETSDILTLKAQGLTDRATARAIGVNDGVVGKICRQPENQAEILARRQWLKSRTSQRLEALIEPAWDMAQQAAEARDAKAFDASMRGLYAKEKISASVSGELQRVHVEHQGQVNVTQEPAVIQLQQLIALVTKDDSPRPPKSQS